MDRNDTFAPGIVVWVLPSWALPERIVPNCAATTAATPAPKKRRRGSLIFSDGPSSRIVVSPRGEVMVPEGRSDRGRRRCSGFELVGSHQIYEPACLEPIGQ